MKLHIVVMPQRGLFQGFGTQRPDWKEEKNKTKKALLWALDQAVARFSSWDHAEFRGGRLQYTPAMGKTLGTESQVQVRWTTNQMQPF